MLTALCTPADRDREPSQPSLVLLDPSRVSLTRRSALARRLFSLPLSQCGTYGETLIR